MHTIFIGWSGQRSRKIAEFLKSWIAEVLKETDVKFPKRRPKVSIKKVKGWVSSKDIETGAQWRDKLNKILRKADVGILCITSENREALYITYEAGSLANRVSDKDRGKALVCPYLIDLYLSRGELPLTLNQFEGARADEEGTRKLVLDICKFLAKKSGLSKADVTLYVQAAEKAFNKKWKKLSAVLKEVQSIRHPQSGTLSDILAEDKRLTDDFKEVRRLIDCHESSIADRLIVVVRGVVNDYRKEQPIDLDGITKLTYDEIERNLVGAITTSAFAESGTSIIVGDVRKFFIDLFKADELGGIIKYEFKPIIDEDTLSSDAKITTMFELLVNKKNQVFSRLHRALAAKLVDYLERK